MKLRVMMRMMGLGTSAYWVINYLFWWGALAEPRRAAACGRARCCLFYPQVGPGASASPGPWTASSAPDCAFPTHRSACHSAA